MTAADRERPTDPLGSPEPFPLPFDAADVLTPVPPPQDLTSIIAELLTLAEVWSRIERDERVPEDVRTVYYRCADAIRRIVSERSPTDVSELAPESAR